MGASAELNAPRSPAAALPGNHTADTVATAMIDAMRELPELCAAPPWDRGSEMAQWRRSPTLAAPVYFCTRLALARGARDTTGS